MLLADRDDAAVTRAALHLVGLPTRTAETFHVVFTPTFRRPPVLVVYDEAIVMQSPLERELLAAFERRRIPLLCVAGEPRPDSPQPLLRRPFTPLEVLGAASRAQPALYECYAGDLVEPDLEDKLVLLTHDLRRASARNPIPEAALSLLDLLGLRDIETALHCRRVQAYARHLAERVAPEILDDDTTDLGFLLHDVGKLALPDRILSKRGPLTRAERELMQTHPVIGAELASGFLPDGRGLNVIRWHHERWDGTGYPDRLTGSAIPIEARCFALADALDALTSSRPYRSAVSWEEAAAMIAADAGTHFDPALVDALDALPRGQAPVGV